MILFISISSHLMKRSTKGVIWLLSPFVFTILSLLLFGFVNTYFSDFSGVKVLNFIISFIGFIGTLDFFIGIPIGIYFLATSGKNPQKGA